MSDENQTTGQHLYAVGDEQARAWFERQWRIWPERADPSLTTNLSLHYDGVVAFRIEHEREPEMSADFRSNVEWLDRHQGDIR